MRKTLLLLSFILCSLLAVSQTVNDKFKIISVLQKTDDMVNVDFSYVDVVGENIEDTKFQIFKYENDEVPESPSIEFSAKARVPEDEVLNANTKFSFYLDGLNLTGNITYKFAIKAIKTLKSGKKEEELIFIYRENSSSFKAVEEQANATEYRFEYGLEDLELSNKKSSSVTVTWKSDCPWGEPAFYTLFDRTTKKSIVTTEETSYTVKNLLHDINYSFFVRAYDEHGNYLSSSNDKYYQPQRVDCVTFTEARKDGNNIRLKIYGYGTAASGALYNETCVYTLFMGEQEGERELNIGNELVFSFNSIDLTKEPEFKLQTRNALGYNAIGLFKLGTDGSAISTQYCDIIFEMQATHVTQYTATIEWGDPGFDANTAVLEIYNLDEDPDMKYPPTKIETIPNPKVRVFSLGNLEHSTNYALVLKLSDQYKNQAKSRVDIKTKVGNICEITNSEDVSVLSCTVDGKFINPYDIEFYTEYDAAKKPLVTVRFRLLGTAEVNKVQLIYTSDGGFISSLLNIRTRAMEKGPDGWYSTTFSNLGNTQMIDGKGMYFAVMVSPAKRCSYLFNYYTTKSISYTVGVGCQDETKFSIIKFTKTYDRQSQFTLQTNGRMASVGVFPEDAYHPEVESEFENEKFDIDKRLFYNNFDDAPSKFTLDISDYKVGTYYLHIHDVYGEAGDLKYLWAIY